MSQTAAHSITQAEYQRVIKDPWFILACDPFHDYEVPIPGYPDRYSESTAVKYSKKSITIRKPANLAPGDTWSCQIATLPLNHTLRDNMVGSFFADRVDFVDVETTTSAFTLGTVNVATAKDNVLLYPSTEVTAASWDALDPANTREYVSFSGTEGAGQQSMSRLIAGGFEVHNDTAELYKSGSVTTYTQPQKLTPPGLAGIHDRASASIGPATVRRGRGLPPSTIHAKQLRNSHTFCASEGCLVPFRLEVGDPDMDFRPASSSLFQFPYADGDLPTGGISSRSELNHAAMVPVQMGRTAAIETSGAFFSGLHETTVLTLTMKFFVEVAPTFANEDILTLSSPSAPFDPMVLECYDHCIRSLKAGVPVRMNDAGEWWRMVLKTLRTAVPAVVGGGLKAIAPEAAFLSGGASSGIQKAIDFAVANSQHRSDQRQASKSNKPKPTAKPNNSLRKIGKNGGT